MPHSASPATPPRRIPVIGIVGGVGSGKSSVTRKLGDLCPIAVVDADRLGHRVLELPAVKDKLRQRFGSAIFDGDGAVIRANLAVKVFGNAPDELAARSDLERITHPEIGRLAGEQIERYQLEQSVQWIVLDAALLLEAGWQTLCDAIVFIDVAAARRADQVRVQRGCSLAEWQRREASQWPVERKQAAADIVIDNNGSLDAAALALSRALAHRFQATP